MLSAPGKLIIDLAAIQGNWRRLSEKLPSATQCGAVVKANAYGLGVAHVAPALAAAGCKTFFVSSLTEGIELRKLISRDAIIYVLHGFELGNESEFYAYQLRPVLFSMALIEQWMKWIEQAEKFVPAAIKVNTGMNRFGVELDEFMQFAAIATQFMQNSTVLILSHLACAEERQNPLNAEQLSQFEQVKALALKVNSKLSFSLANSSGIFLGQNWHYDLVRPGAALYGVNPTPESTNPMSAVVSLNLKVLQVRQLKKGECIGYGHCYQAPKDMPVAIAGGGYADGIARVLSNQTQGFFNAKPVPLIGRVSMDAVAFDLSAVAQQQEQVNFIELIGEHQCVDSLAKNAGTIGYEILTQLGQRYEREYRVSKS